MIYVGQIYKATETQIAQLTTEQAGAYMMVTITVGQTEMISFPMPTDSDSNEIALRATNIINQTGLAPTDCRVDVQEV